MKSRAITKLILDAAREGYKQCRASQDVGITGMRKQIKTLTTQRQQLIAQRDRAENDLSRAFEVAGMTSGTIDQLVQRIKEYKSNELAADVVEVLSDDMAKITNALGTANVENMLKRIAELVYWYDGHDLALQEAKRKARECPPSS